MIVVKHDMAKAHFREAVALARERGILENFRQRLAYLGSYSNQDGGYFARSQGANTKCVLYKDRDAGDFYFVMFSRKRGEDWKQWFNGGLILHDDHWGVHT